MSFYEGLSDKGEVLRPLLEKGISDGSSNAAILTALQDADMGYRKSVFGSDMRVLRQAANNFSNLKALPYDKPVTDKYYAVTTKPMARNYQTVVKFVGVNTETGEKLDRYVTIQHDTVLSRRAIEDTATIDLAETSPKFEATQSYPIRARQASIKR